MAVFVAVLFVVAKVLLFLLVGLVLLALLLIVLPVRATVQGECRAEGDLDALLEAGGTDFGEMPEPVITVIPDGTARATALGGLLGVEYHTGDPLKVLLAGVPFLRLPLGARARRRTSSSEEEEAVAPKTSESVEIQRKAGPLNTREARRSSKAEGRGESAGRKRGFALTLGAKGAGGWFSPKVREMALRTAKRLVRGMRLRGHVHAEYGVGDPGVTGMAYAAFVTWSGMTGQRWLTLEPNFVDDVILVRVEGETRFFPVQMAYVAGRFLLSREIRPLWRKKRVGESRKAPVLGAHTSG